MYVILKVALISALGSGDQYGVETAFEILDLCGEIDSLSKTDNSELLQELKDLTENAHWQDCIAFYRIFDPEAFLQERFPEYY